MKEEFWNVWNREGGKVSKIFIGWFLIFCLYQGIFGTNSLGFVWVPYLVIGMFCASLLGIPYLALVMWISYLQVNYFPSSIRFIKYARDLLILPFLILLFLQVEDVVNAFS